MAEEVVLLKKIILAALALGAITVPAPSAMADEPTFGCGFRSVQQDDATGQNYEGVAYGYIAHAEGGEVSIRCAIEVSGSEVTSTPPGTGTAFASTAGRVTFAAADTEVVTMCAWVVVHGVARAKVCSETNRVQIPPQEVIDLINDVFRILNEQIFIPIVDPLICPRLAEREGTYGPVTIGPDGDVSIDGELWWDCMPYVIDPPA